MNITAKKIYEFNAHSAAVYSVCKGWNDETFFTASGDRFVAAWNVKTLQQEKFSARLDDGLFSVHFIKGFDTLLIGTGGGNIHVIDFKTKEERANLKVHHKGVFDFAFSPKKNFIFAAGGDGSVSVWDITTLNLIIQIPVAEEKVRRVILDKEEKHLAVACGDGVVRMFETEFWNEVASFNTKSGGVSALAFHPVKPIIISGDKNAHLKFFNITDGDEVLDIAAHNFGIYDVVFNSSAKLCATCSRDKTIKIWDGKSMIVLARLDAKAGGHTHSVNRLLWMDEETLVSVGDDRKIVVWSVCEDQQN
ncbi:MAG: WD40 repeat domain-containing protein [Flavobacteriales bacterium]|nr:WD40 repeat domain-containing protein [Flavobacteriales bacterium]